MWSWCVGLAQQAQQFLRPQVRDFCRADLYSDCRKINRLQPGIPTWVDAVTGAQIHRNIHGGTVISAVAGDFDAQCSDFPKPSNAFVGNLV